MKCNQIFKVIESAVKLLLLSISNVTTVVNASFCSQERREGDGSSWK